MEHQPSPIPAHLIELTTPEHTAWEGFFKGFMHAARREKVSPRDFFAYTSFPYEEPRELSLLTVYTTAHRENSIDYIHSLLFHVWRGRRWAATASATGILLHDNLHLLETRYFSDTSSAFSQEDTYPLLHHVGGVLEQPEEYQIYPRL